MKKTLFFIMVGLFLFNSRLTSQRGQAIYAEVLGNGIVFSFNYDVRFNNQPKGIGLGYVFQSLA